MTVVEPLAPSGDAVLDYDRCHLVLYAALLEAEDEGLDWREPAVTLMGLDVTLPDAECCWRSHLERARWIVDEGLGTAIAAFDRRIES